MGRAVAQRLAAGGGAPRDKRHQRQRRGAHCLGTTGRRGRSRRRCRRCFRGGRRAPNSRDRVGALPGGRHTVNNAGILRRTGIMDLEEDEWDLVLNVNLKGTYLCTRAVLPAMQRAGWGRIINFSSTAGRSVSTLGGPALYHRQGGCPGLHAGGGQRGRPARDHGERGMPRPGGHGDGEVHPRRRPQKSLRRELSHHPPRRAGRGGGAGAFLASDRAAYITGASLDINGGDLMM